jgi:DNA-binding transcriptional MerR regulator
MVKKNSKEDTEKNYLTIGRIVKKMKKIYPDLSSSKLRFLESEGLINPGRALNKYRIYFKEDIEKINYILKMQKEFYMPLDVIKEKLKSRDFKKFTSESEYSPDSINFKLEEEYKTVHGPKQYSALDLNKKFKMPKSYLDGLIENDIFDWKEENGKYLIDEDDIEILRIISELLKYGVYARHLKLFENFAGRQSAFIQQIILPLLMSSKKEEHNRAIKNVGRLERMLCDFQELLVKKGNRKFLEKYK